MTHNATATVNCTTSLQADAALWNRVSAKVAAVCSTSFAAALNIIHEVTATAAASASWSASANRIWGSNATIRGAFGQTISGFFQHSRKARFAGQFGMVNTPTVLGQGLIVSDVVRAVMTLWDLSPCCQIDLTACRGSEIINAINAALQTIWAQAHRLDNFNRATVTLTFDEGESQQSLDESVQMLHGPVRLASTKMPLREVSRLSEFDQYIDLYYGGQIPDSPRAYHLEKHNQAASDNVHLILRITPAASEQTNLLVDVALEAPRYTWADVSAGTPLSIPHRYAETLLLPLVKKWASSHNNFRRPDLKEEIESQFSLAMNILGMVAPDSEASAKSSPDPIR